MAGRQKCRYGPYTASSYDFGSGISRAGTDGMVGNVVEYRWIRMPLMTVFGGDIVDTLAVITDAMVVIIWITVHLSACAARQRLTAVQCGGCATCILVALALLGV